MLLCVHKDYPSVISATHRDTQLSEISAAYPATEFQIVKVSGYLGLDSSIPEDAEIVRPFAPTLEA